MEVFESSCGSGNSGRPHFSSGCNILLLKYDIEQGQFTFHNSILQSGIENNEKVNCNFDNILILRHIQI